MSAPSAPLPNFSLGEGLLPAIAQDAETGEVLMMAYMNAESFAETLASGQACYYSRSRGTLMAKGRGERARAVGGEVLVDCDGDAILLKVEQQGGAACHTGYRSCFYRRLTPRVPRSWASRCLIPTRFIKRAEAMQRRAALTAIIFWLACQPSALPCSSPVQANPVQSLICRSCSATISSMASIAGSRPICRPGSSSILARVTPTACSRRASSSRRFAAR